jgi:two-component system sensor histidine kinase YesM
MAAFWARLGQYLTDLPIKRKLLLSYLFFISLPLILFSVISFGAIARYYEDQVWFSANQSFDLTHTFLSTKTTALVKASDIVYFSPEVQTALSRTPEVYRDNVIQQQVDMLNLDNYLGAFANSQDVFRVTLYVPGWLTYADQKIRFDNLDKLKSDPAYAQFLTSKEKVTWFPAETISGDFDVRQTVPVLSMYRKIRDVNDFSKVIGVIRISVLESLVTSIVGKANTTRNGLVFLRNAQGTIISARPQDKLRVEKLQDELGRRPPLEESVWTSLTLGGQAYSLQSRTIASSDWSLVSAVPAQDIRYQSERLRDLLVALVLIIGTLAYFSAALLTRSTTRRLSALTAAMNQIQDNRFPLPPASPSHDEIGLLTNTFRTMVVQIQSLLEAQYRAGQELKNAELKALQAQINPHFLSNTLELINWQAINKGVPEIAEISRALAKFYSLSLNNGRDVVSIRDELDHVRTYVEIQNRRFGNRIAFVLEVSERIQKFTIVKLLLQPLVENSILHGILERGEDQGGRIRVAARTVGPDIHLSVEDDGVGMTPAQIQAVFAEGKPGDSHGYGVKNIHSRIRLHYGEGYGLSFTSTPGKGTVALLTLPQVR